MSRLLELLSFRAALDPEGVAVQHLKGATSWRQLHVGVRKAAALLRESGVQPGQIVVTALLDKGLDWTMALALAHEGAISCSSQNRKGWSCGFACDWVITDEPGSFEEQARVIRVSAGWIEGLRSIRPGAIRPRERATDAVARIVLTSGTTGDRKGVALTEAQIIGRASDSLRFRNCTLALSTVQLTGAPELNASVMALLFGSPVYVTTSAANTAEFVRRFGVDGLFGSPQQMGQLVRHLDEADESLAGVRAVRLVGASTPTSLIDGLTRRVTSNIQSLYGSTETGGMAACHVRAGQDPGVAGPVQPGSRIEIVDEEGRPVADGEEGSVRARTPWMATAYYQDPEASALAFRDGWFHPGDRGRLQDGILVLTGRDNDVINRGGSKLNPVVLDDFLGAFPGVRDAAVFLTEEAGAPARIVAAIVAEDGFRLRRLREAVAARFKGRPVPDHFVVVTHIPRTDAGKVQRSEMARLFASRPAPSP